MKSVVLLTILIALQTNLNYTFDYRLEYEFYSNSSDFIKTTNYYINSQNNNYNVSIEKTKDKKNFLFFADLNLLRAMAYVDGNIENPVSLKIPDSLILQHKNTRKNSNIDNYTLQKLNDTVLNNKAYKMYVLRYKNLKKAKRKKIGKHIYIIDESKNFKPLISNEILFDVQAHNLNLPNGIIIEKHVYKSDGKLNYSEKLKGIHPLDFEITLERN